MNCKVLLMTANPEKQNLRLDAEQRALMDAVHRSERQRQLRDAGSVSGAIEFVRVGATRLRDVPRMVQLHRPHALHFSGHGANGGELIFEDEAGQTRYTARARHWRAEDCSAHEAMGFHQGWGIATDQLAALAATL